MQYATLGTTGLLVSRFAVGSMTFTESHKGHASMMKVDTKLADEIVGRACDAGVNFFDTADVYGRGESEIVLGKALQSRRKDVVIATKCGLRSGTPLGQSGLSRNHVIWSVEQSLRRLGTDWIDVYIAHREDPLTPLEETLEVFDTLVRSGKVRYIGFSNWSAWKVAAAVEIQRSRGWARFTHGQMHYSLLSRDVERDVVPMMRRYGLGMTVWSPLAYGFLSGKLSPETIKTSDSRFAESVFLPFDRNRGFELVEKIRTIATAHEASVAQVALAWLLAQESVTSILIGITKKHQLEDNFGAMNVKLSTSEFAELDTETQLPLVYPNWFAAQFADQPVVAALRSSSVPMG
jgi:aryl-alcohol dehydrogenase-like predicted oxidoreductase